MKNLLEEDAKDPLDPENPLTEQEAFDVAVEMLQECLNMFTLESVKNEDE